MKKTVAVLLCLVLLLLAGCNSRTPLEQHARTCWDRIGSADTQISRIHVICYTSRLALSGEVLDTPMYKQIPEQGYAILFYSRGTPSFYGSYACFLDTGGNVVLTFNYEENYRLYEKYYANFSIYNIEAGERALEYLTNCNYISGMINDAGDAQLRGQLEKDVWYRLSEDQTDWVLR